MPIVFSLAIGFAAGCWWMRRRCRSRLEFYAEFAFYNGVPEPEASAEAKKLWAGWVNGIRGCARRLGSKKYIGGTFEEVSNP